MRNTIGYKQTMHSRGISPCDAPMRPRNLKLSVCRPPSQQSGEGFMDTMKSMWEKAKNVGSKASELYSSELGTALRNALPDSDENARPGFAGEKHAILKLPNGKTGVANYMGPGTKVIERIRRGDPPRTEADRVAQAHDVRYALTNDPVAVRNADLKMIADLKKIEREKRDNPYNVALGKNIMKAKVLGEKAGVIKRDLFTATNPAKAGSEEQKVLMDQLNKLEQAGYGLPASDLRMNMLKEANKIRKVIRKKVKKGSGVVLAGQKRGRGFTTSMYQGAGVSLSGGKMKAEPDVFMDFLEKKYAGNGAQEIAETFAKQISGKIVPDILEKIKKLAGKSGGAIKLPARTTYGAKLERDVLEALQKTPQWIQNVRMKGDGLWDWIKTAAKTVAGPLMSLVTPENVSKVISVVPGINKYAQPLGDALAPLLKAGLSKVAGSGMLGSGFFGDFIEGLKYGWNRSKDVLSKLPVVGEVARAIPALPESKIKNVNGKLVMGKGLMSHHKRLHGSGVSLPGHGVSLPGKGVSLPGKGMKMRVKKRKA